MVRDSGRERPFALESSRTSGYDDPLEPGIREIDAVRGTCKQEVITEQFGELPTLDVLKTEITAP